MTTPTVIIRSEPTDADLHRLMNIARETVKEIAGMGGALGHDAIALLYVERIYAGVVAGAVKPKKRGRK
jgi:hypothetical protein